MITKCVTSYVECSASASACWPAATKTAGPSCPLHFWKVTRQLHRKRHRSGSSTKGSRPKLSQQRLKGTVGLAQGWGDSGKHIMWYVLFADIFFVNNDSKERRSRITLFIHVNQQITNETTNRLGCKVRCKSFSYWNMTFRHSCQVYNFSLL